MKNRLYYGDNLEILRNREYFPDECVDLIYLGPPFNSNRNYNVLFKSESGADSEAQITAFEDTWHWGGTAVLKIAFSEQTLKWRAWGKKFRRLQILTIGDLFGGAGVDMPPQYGSHQQAARWKRGGVSVDGESQRELI